MVPTEICSQMYYQSYILYLTWTTGMWCGGCPLKLSTKLKRLQNFAGRIILKEPKQTSATWVRKELGWSTLAARRRLHMATLVFKLRNNLAPDYLTVLMVSSSNACACISIVQELLPPIASMHLPKSPPTTRKMLLVLLVQ